MTVPSLSMAGSRISEIQSNFAYNTPRNRSFAETLDAARNVVAPTAAGFVVEPQPAPATPVPIGILGTPIVLRSDNPLSNVGTDWMSRLPAAGQQWTAEIERAATAAGIDSRLLAAMVWQESGFSADAVSRSGAIGLAQLMPATADGLGVDPHDPVQNLEGGARYLAWTIEEFGSIELGLAAYNAGPGRVREAGGVPNIAETQAYVPRVLDYYRQLGGVA